MSLAGVFVCPKAATRSTFGRHDREETPQRGRACRQGRGTQQAMLREPLQAARTIVPLSLAVRPVTVAAAEAQPSQVRFASVPVLPLWSIRVITAPEITVPTRLGAIQFVALAPGSVGTSRQVAADEVAGGADAGAAAGEGVVAILVEDEDAGRAVAGYRRVADELRNPAPPPGRPRRRPA